MSHLDRFWVLMRTALAEAEEVEAARRHFDVCKLRTEVPRGVGAMVVPRYSALPYMQELEADLKNLGCRLINTYAQHQYVADLDYYMDLSDVTFRTWFRLQDVPASMRDKPLVVKGRTNSRKFDWTTHMFARDFRAAVDIACELGKDGLIGSQGVVLREFVPLETFETTITGLPVTNEWRLFFYRGRLLAHGYYWGLIDNWDPVHAARPDFESAGIAFAQSVADRIGDQVPFVVIDIAKTQDGRWLVVELNDGCQAGLNGTVDPDTLYRNLRAALADERAA